MTTALAVACILALLRISAFVAFMPLLSGPNVPNTVKVGLAVGLTALWCVKFAPETAVSVSLQGIDNWLLLGWLAMRETLLGAAVGWLLGLILVPVRIAGAYIVQEMGLSIASITSAADDAPSNVVSQLLEILAVLLLFAMNIHHAFLRLFDALFSMFPLARPWTCPSSDWVIGTVTRTDELGLALAAPVGVVLFGTLILSLYAMRQTPQFNLFTFGMPLRLLVGLAALLLFLPDLVQGMVTLFQDFASFRGIR
jgi:flagellar biosynthesis protein FliR